MRRTFKLIYQQRAKILDTVPSSLSREQGEPMQEKVGNSAGVTVLSAAFATLVVVTHHTGHAYSTFKHRFGYSTIGHNWT